MTKRRIVYIVGFLIAATSCIHSFAQENILRNYQLDNRGKPIKKDTTGEKLQHRDAFADSITISYHYFDSTRTYKIDSSINNFYTRFPVSYTYNDLGNFGTAVQSFIFTPYMKPGWDAGFHSYDPYYYTIENTKLYTTTRPYTELAYMLGSRSEQMINIMHTQNRKSSLNFGFEYRLINSPGAFKSQNASNSSMRINISYTTKDKRYNSSLIYIANKTRASANGGIQTDTSLTNLLFGSPFSIPVRLGDSTPYSRNFFTSSINTGESYNQTVVMFRHSYDLGQKDSLVTDSVTYKLFYPRIRFQQTIEYLKQKNAFQDFAPQDSLYMKYYHFTPPGTSVNFKDAWDKLASDFAIISYPQKNNQNQFLKLVAGIELIAGGYYPYNKKYNNIYFGGEYRNRTRNKKWDVVASGRFYTAGEYAGDYEAYFTLERLLNNNKGALLVGFQNVNRTPSVLFNKDVTSFPVFADEDFNKENISRFFADINLASLGLRLAGEYYIISNYPYFDNFFSAKQESSLFNVIHAEAEKKIKLARFWNWYIEAHVQQATANAPVNLPLLFAENRFAFEGNFFKNLFISTGFEVRYYTNLTPDNYSPFTGQFFVQNSYSTKDNRPDVHAYLNFRIKSFKGFIRAENLGTFNLEESGIGFTKNNFAAPHYPQRSFWFRAGIWWNFVN